MAMDQSPLVKAEERLGPHSDVITYRRCSAQEGGKCAWLPKVTPWQKPSLPSHQLSLFASQSCFPSSRLSLSLESSSPTALIIGQRQGFQMSWLINFATYALQSKYFPRAAGLNHSSIAIGKNWRPWEDAASQNPQRIPLLFHRCSKG